LHGAGAGAYHLRPAEPHRRARRVRPRPAGCARAALAAQGLAGDRRHRLPRLRHRACTAAEKRAGYTAADLRHARVGLPGRPGRRPAATRDPGLRRRGGGRRGRALAGADPVHRLGAHPRQDRRRHPQVHAADRCLRGRAADSVRRAVCRPGGRGGVDRPQHHDGRDRLGQLQLLPAGALRAEQPGQLGLGHLRHHGAAAGRHHVRGDQRLELLAGLALPSRRPVRTIVPQGEAMRAECNEAIDAATSLGASYADVRIINYRKEGVALRNGQPCNLSSSDTLGAGIRVIVNGAWGFASTNQVNNASLKEAARRAVEIARASAQVKKQDVRLAPKRATEDIWCTPFTIDPFKVSLEDKLGLLLKIDALLRAKPEIKVAMASMQFAREKQWYMDNEGSFIVQDLLRSGAGYSATAVGNGDVQIRSFPQSWGGNHKCMGYEIVGAYDLLGNAERIRDEAIALLTAPECPSGKMDLILDGPQLALQIHESVGNANELDRVFGFEANYAGRSFMLPELNNAKGGFKYGSEHVNLVADCTVHGG